MRTRSLLCGITGLVVLLTFVPATQAAGPFRRQAPKVSWHSDLHSAHRVSVKSGKPILIVFGADWCGYCKKLDRTTLQHPEMVSYIESAFVPVHLDFDKEREIAKILEVKSLPCSVVLSPDADLLGKLVGYVEADKYYQSLEASRQLQQRIQQAQNIQRDFSR